MFIIKLARMLAVLVAIAVFAQGQQQRRPIQSAQPVLLVGRNWHRQHLNVRTRFGEMRLSSMQINTGIAGVTCRPVAGSRKEGERRLRRHSKQHISLDEMKEMEREDRLLAAGGGGGSGLGGRRDEGKVGQLCYYDDNNNNNHELVMPGETSLFMASGELRLPLAPAIGGGGGNENNFPEAGTGGRGGSKRPPLAAQVLLATGKQQAAATG